MVRIELSDEQARTLRDMMESWLGDLRMEVSSTDQKDWRDALKAREALLKEVIQQLSTSQPQQ
jgi:hypothetical protein